MRCGATRAHLRVREAFGRGCAIRRLHLQSDRAERSSLSRGCREAQSMKFFPLDFLWSAIRTDHRTKRDWADMKGEKKGEVC